ncbi:MAG: trxB, partial [Agromyces sp.]|nr:trxB [Agromyces sp.]
MRDIIIIGSGPAGFSAAIYAARAELKPLLIASSVEIGGELMNTTEVENYPGFPDGIMGPDLMAKFQAQAERFGTEVVYDDVVELELDGPVKRVKLGNGGVEEARSIVYATGSAYRKLGLPEEEVLSGHGLSWCATCDGFFFRQKTIAVIGGGDSAMEEATFLTRFADKVYVIHRRDTLKASKIMQQRAFDNPKIEFIWNAEVTAIHGDSQTRARTSCTASSNSPPRAPSRSRAAPRARRFRVSSPPATSSTRTTVRRSPRRVPVHRPPSTPSTTS